VLPRLEERQVSAGNALKDRTLDQSMTVPLHVTWEDIAVRLVLTVLAGALIGFNREAKGHAAGLRTTILIGLAASLAMIQANILLPIGGKTPESFGVMDLMRLPLGILTGVGFIGGGAILRRGEFVTGVTTAATIWVMTVIGLCYGGGQLVLGSVGTFLALLTLWLLEWLDARIPREHHAMLVISASATSSSPADIHELIASDGFHARLLRQNQSGNAQHPTCSFEIRWTRPAAAVLPLGLLKLLERHYKIEAFELTDEVIR
jgi:putative Mg2+ transporter-C (MgtC) family protein